MEQFTKIYNAAVGKIHKFFDKQLIDRCAALVDPADQSILKPLIETQHRVIVEARNKRKFIDPDVERQLCIATEILRKYVAIRALVGIQPMQGPVGLVYSMAFSTTNDEMCLEIEPHAIEASSRRLQSQYSIEAAQDMKMVHDIDVVAEFSAILSTEIAHELIAEILSDIVSLAPIEQVDIPYRQDTFANQLWAHIMVQRNEIARLTRRGAGNVFVMSPMLFESLVPSCERCSMKVVPADTYDRLSPFCRAGTLIMNANNTEYAIYTSSATQLFGTDGRYRVIVGYKGASEVDAGYIASPYVPIIANHTIDPASFQPAMRFINRGGKWISKNACEQTDYYRILDVGVTY